MPCERLRHLRKPAVLAAVHRAFYGVIFTSHLIHQDLTGTVVVLEAPLSFGVLVPAFLAAGESALAL